MTTETYDVLIIGGGHNGLICGSYLARAGLSVCVFERKHRPNGNCLLTICAEPLRYSIVADHLEHFVLNRSGQIDLPVDIERIQACPVIVGLRDSSIDRTRGFRHY